MDISEFSDKLFSKAKDFGFTDAEVYYASGDSFGVDIYDGEIREYKRANSAGVSFRGNIGGRTGYAYTEVISGDALDFLLENAGENAAVNEDGQEQISPPADDYTCFPEVEATELSVDMKINYAKDIESKALGLDKRVSKIIHSYVGNGTSGVYIANSRGMSISRANKLAYAYIYLQAEENGRVKTGYDFFVDIDFTRFDPEILAVSAVKNATDLLGAKNIKTGTYNAVFDNRVMADLLAAFTGVFYAETAQKGFSLLLDKEGAKIASDCITIKDMTCHPKAIVNIPFDDEGEPCLDKTVVDNGVLRTLLYNRKSAGKANRDTGGNGFKDSFKASVATGTLNFYIAPSKYTRAELLETAHTGVLVTKLAGLHSGVNAVSGDFSVQADGFLIENGVVAGAVEQFTVAGNFYSFIKNIDAVSDDLFFDMPSVGSIGAPSCFVRGLAVAGAG